jgi:small-conductance mechanosensitive channel
MRRESAVLPAQANATTAASDPAGRFDPIRGLFDGPLSAVPAPVVNLLIAAAVLLVGWYVSKLVVRIAGRTVARRFRRPSVTRTVLRSVRLSVLLLAAFLAASVYGLQVGDLLISVTVFSAVIGIVLAPIVGSIVNGLFVLADQPYEIGDMIELADRGQRGFVEDITLRYTKIFTLDNTFIVVPNATIRERDVINYSAEDERTRLSLKVVVTYEGDLAEARDLVERAARNVEEVITGGPDIRIGAARYPAGPTCYIDDFGDHGVLLNLRYWAKEPYKLLTMRSKVQTRVWDALEDADVEIAYPHSHVVFDDTSGQARVALSSENGRGPTTEDHLDPAVVDARERARPDDPVGDGRGADGPDDAGE